VRAWAPVPAPPAAYRPAAAHRRPGAVRGDVDPVKEAKALVNELKKYDEELVDKPRWLVLNKLDMVPEEERAKKVKDFVKKFGFKGPVFEISALSHEGTQELVNAIRSIWKKPAASSSVRKKPRWWKTRARFRRSIRTIRASKSSTKYRITGIISYQLIMPSHSAPLPHHGAATAAKQGKPPPKYSRFSSLVLRLSHP
jgi:hypothetical protein